jgi:NADH-quinone oxidoreductase subunit L
LYWMLGGDKPLRSGAYLAVGGMVVTAVLSLVGLWEYLTTTHTGGGPATLWAERIDWVRIGPWAHDWTSGVSAAGQIEATQGAIALQLGYRIDALAAVLFAMVAVVSLAIFVFALGYMDEETHESVEDHPAQHQYHRQAPVRRRGRFGRFYLFLSLFSFSMLHLLIADNLFQIFVSWELVGVCSFWLIGFYQERPSASWAANKAFIINRVGDAGFLLGMAIAWTHLGTLNLEEIFQRLRGPEGANGSVMYARAPAESHAAEYEQSAEPTGYVLVHPVGITANEAPMRGAVNGATQGFDVIPQPPTSDKAPLRWSVDGATVSDYAIMPYWLWVVMGVGLLLGCVGKSAQWPLHTWLPDAMEGPTPVSALIHAATMVAAGVYLVGRCYPLWAPEVLLTTAYLGAITAFLAATIATVQTDIKRVLAYSTCSQLGLMFLALGIGGWVAGLLHLLTHAFFKALLFLGAGSVIHACHHVQEIQRLGGLRRRMPMTAYTMLIGVLAIAGAPLLSGWYSKERILTQVVGLAVYQPQHVLLWLLPLVTTILTAYYMFRLWLLTFAGPARDEMVYQQVQESPPIMTGPLVLLAILTVVGAWGWPVWQAEASWLGRVVEQAQPAMVREYAQITHAGHRYHWLAAGVGLLCALTGAAAAIWWYGRQATATQPVTVQTSLGQFLWRQWYFDELYEAMWLRPTVRFATILAATDKHAPQISFAQTTGDDEPTPPRFDWRTLDGWLNALGDAATTAAAALRRWQTGRVRWYVLTLVLTVALILGILTALAG